MKRPMVIYFFFFVLGISTYYDLLIPLGICISIFIFLLINNMGKVSRILLLLLAMALGICFVNIKDYNIPYNVKIDLEVELIEKKEKTTEGRILTKGSFYGKRISLNQVEGLSLNKKYKVIGKFGKDYNAYNPNVFNYEYYNKSINSLGYFRVNSFEYISENVAFNNKIRNCVKNNLKRISEKISTDYSAFYYCYLSGNSEYIDSEDLTRYRDLSIAHILAVSGFHIALIYKIAAYICKKIKISNNSSKLLALVFIGIYVYYVSPNISSLRAFVFIGINSLSYFINRRKDLESITCITAFIFIIFNPFIVYDIGFQLSFSAVFSIALFNDIVKRIVKYDVFSIPISVSILVIPVSVYWFGKVYLLSILVNIIVVTMFSFLYPTLFIIVVLNAIFERMVIVNSLYNKIYACFDNLISWIYNVSHNEKVDMLFNNVNLSWYIFLFLFFLIIAICLAKEKKLRLRRSILICLLTLTLIMIFRLSVVEIYFFDVGQGDCILIKSYYKNILIDSGYDYSEGALEKILNRNGVNEIDLVIISHLHRDHYGGLINIKNIKIDKILMTRDNYIEEFQCFGDKIEFVDKIEENILGKFYLTYLPGMPYSDNENNRSLNVIIKTANKKFMFTGDSEMELERLILKNYPNLAENIDILKVAHHGSNTSSIEEFVKKTKPKYAIIQVGENNYGLPKDEVINRYIDNGSKVYNNQTNGCVKISVLGDFFFIRTFKRR